jgi:hypothetical protein
MQYAVKANAMNETVRFPNRRLGVICCGHVFRRERKVRLVGRESGGWQFMCGGVDHHSSKDGHWVMVGVLLEFDPSLDQLADLPPGSEAERQDTNLPWIRTKSGARHA